MKVLFGILLAVTLVSCGSEYDSALSSQQPTKVSSKHLDAGHYIVSFQNESTCMSGEQSLKEFHLTQGVVETKSFSVNAPIINKGLVTTAVCRFGYNTAKANVVIGSDVNIVAPQGWEIASIEKVESVVMPKTLKPFQSAILDAGTYIFENQRFEECTSGAYNFNFERTYKVVAGSFLMTDIHLKNSTPIDTDLIRPAVCTKGNGYASGVVTLTNPLKVSGKNGVSFLYKKVVKTSNVAL